MLTSIAFITAIGLLVVVHELGHYLVALACGVKVLRFSVGFGPRLGGWTSAKYGTEFIISALPLGGYVRLLDERDGTVSPDDRLMALNTQPLARRVAVVSAGPLANLVLATFLYAVVNWVGVQQPQAVLAKPADGSVLSNAGFVGGELVARAALGDDELQEIASFDDFRWWLTRGALEQRDVRLAYTDASGNQGKLARLPISLLNVPGVDPLLLQKMGVQAPFSKAAIGEVLPSGAAYEAGLRSGDVVLQVDGTAIVDASQLRELIRMSGNTASMQRQKWEVLRNGLVQTMMLTPRIELDRGVSIGRVGAFIGYPPAMVRVRYGLAEGFGRAACQTWEISRLTLTMLWQILAGEASLKNISGPITIADYAGKSAALGLTQYLTFLALVSVSLGVLNLLPLPVLDGGHLMYYLWESLTGKPVSDLCKDRLLRLGLAMLLMMMSVAVFNDVSRLLG